ncbi:MAG: flagellar hook-associated protein FlgL [Jatrophihabitans sp.]|uniref:flagellar hook-associated protein FlgL n=1 Tax=Jatrophihabitans sp. TaxID=1932789 RepID=UPI003F8114C5
MSLRVTEGSLAQHSLRGLQTASSRLDTLQAKMSSGNQITKPSDDPAGTVQALKLRASLSRMGQYTTNQNFAQGWLSMADSAYSSAVNQVQSARTIVVQGLNSGAMTPEAMSSLADQVDAIRSSLLATANTTYNGRPIFAGTSGSPVAYDSSGNYQGDGGAITRTIGENASIQVNQTGPTAFGAPGSDVFSLLSDIAGALRSGDTSTLSGQLGQVDGALRQLSAAQAAEGAAAARITQAQTTQAANTLTLKTQLSGIQDIDLADMAIQVTTANTNYQAALQTTASIRQLSLLDFLR